MLRFWFFFFALLSWGARPALSHPMGNFSINHYARFEAHPNQLSLRYILDFAEIPTAERMPQLDRNGDNIVGAPEKSAYLPSEAARFAQGLSLRVNGREVALVPRHFDLEVRAGAGGLPTLRVWVDCAVPLPAGQEARVDYRDSNFEGRTGWMEIIAGASGGLALRGSNASSIDRSRGLTVFPIDAGVVPPRQNSASFTIVKTGATGAGATGAGATGAGATTGQSGATTGSAGASASATNDQTPQNGFTQSIAQRNLTPSVLLGGLLAALLFGAVHALSPGHGKTMVAAYLVGSRGTPRHAVLLGLVVTITHTLGVFALGFGLLFASSYILPEKLFPALSALSGMLIFGVGLWLFMARWQGLTQGHSHSHDDEEHDHPHEHGEHEHSHDNDSPSHGGHTHSHGGRAHSHAVPEGPITMRTLVALGISGGIVPCPEALVVLLAAIKLHRIGYGMVLITAFSIGLAAALIAIGLLVVSARGRLSRFDKLGEGNALTRFLPLGSAALITVIGAALTLRATMGGL